MVMNMHVLNVKMKLLKTCSLCLRIKNINEYNKFRLGYNKFCKDCETTTKELDDIKIKNCYVCKVDKNIDEFYDRIENFDRKENTCKVCYNNNKKILKQEKDERELIKQEDGAKKCKKCNIVKQFEFFPVHSTSKDGYEFTCYDCKGKKAIEIKEKRCDSCRKYKDINNYNKFRLGYNKYCKDCEILPKNIDLNNNENTKPCSNCKIYHNISNFTLKTINYDGYSHICKDCSKEINSENKKNKKLKQR